MSLQLAAQHLASKGRGPDTELIHMTKGEIASLQELAKAHGGSLTINPHTGLVEAGFLKSLLPTVIGGATAIFAPWALPYVAGGIGAYAWDKTGSLGKGLMAGLSAYSGGQLASGLAGLGTSEAGASVSAAAEKAGEEAAQQAVAQQAAQQEALTANPNMWDSVGAQARPSMVSPEVAAQSAREYAANAYVPTAAQQSALSNPAWTGLKAAIDSPSKLATQMGGWSSLGKLGLAAASPAISDALTPKKQEATASTSADLGPRFKYSPGTASPSPAYSGAKEQSYFPGQSYTQITPTEAKALYGFAGGGDIQGDPNMMNVPTYDPVVRMARGGLSDLGGYSDGGRLLKGPGDGVSDSIPAEIGGKQPARLADGEFVVPARIVSELGNGSTEAGARQLYAMMDRVQQARQKTVGKGKIAKNTKSAKYLPA